MYVDRCECECKHRYGPDGHQDCADTFCGYCLTGEPPRVHFTRPDHDDTHTVKTTSDVHGEFLICLTCVVNTQLGVGRYSPEGRHEVLRDDHLGGVGVVGDGEGD
jgi:hypothetical protein